MKIALIGSKQHGKDTVAEFITKHSDLRCQGSSMLALEIFLFDMLQEKYGYETLEQAYEDRHSCRQDWFDAITAYNIPDRTKLARQIMAKNDVYVGMRNSGELEACLEEGVFDMVVGVVDPRKEVEVGSNQIDVNKYSDVLITNDGTLEELEEKVVYLLKHFGLWNKTI